ncbi:GEVED domain-containing protein [Nereida ignava]|uniref:GEVED domain-containing protein n=1 Tax=Nereida ignava TaxID=282199 RepID=UPI002FE2D4D6
MTNITIHIAAVTLAIGLWLLAPPVVAQTSGSDGCDELCISASSSMLNDVTSGLQFTDQMLSSLIGVNLGLDDVRLDLVGSQVPINDFVAELENVTGTNSADEALNSEATLSEIFTAAANAAETNGDPAAGTALRALASNASGLSDGVLLSDFLVLDTTDDELSDANISTLDLISGSAQLYNAEYGVTTPTPIVANIVSLGEVRTYVQVTEPPQLVCGPEGTTFRSAAIRTKIDVTLENAPQSIDVGLAALEIEPPEVSFYIEVGEADGTVTDVDAANQTAQVTMTPGVVNAYLGEIDDSVYFNRDRVITASDIGPSTIAGAEVTLAGLPPLVPETIIPTSISASSNGETVSFGSGTLEFTGPYPQTEELDVPVDATERVVNAITNNLQVDLELPGGGSLDAVEVLLETALSTTISEVVDDSLTAALGQAVDPILAGLGITIGGGEATAFGLSDTCDDFGDCPISGTAPDGTNINAYGTPSHGLSPALFMGQIPADGEQQHISSPSALGDDQDGNDDEDGVSIPVLTKGQTATISVNVTEPTTGNGYLMAWLDWDGNGQFDADEVISDDLQDTDGDGDISLSVSVPADSSLQTTFARFRYSSTQQLGTNANATDGEVEDYEIVFVTPQGSISGKLFEDGNGDDIFTTGETLLPAGILITLFDDKGTPQDETDDIELGTTETDANGAYSFAALSTLTTYLIKVDPSDPEIPADLSPSTDNPLRAVSVSIDTDTSEQNFGFSVQPPSADLSITKRALSASTSAVITEATAGTEIDFELVVSNAGPDTATGVQVLELLPSGYTYQSHALADGTQSFAADTGLWQVGELAAGTSQTLTIRATMNATGEHTNIAEIINSDLPDPDSDPSTGPTVDDLSDNIADDDEASATVSYVGTGAVISGTLFIDNGSNATAFDGQQSGGELGGQIGQVSIFDASGALIDTPEVDADGNWSLTLPDGYTEMIGISSTAETGFLIVSNNTNGLPELNDQNTRDGIYSFRPAAGTSYLNLDIGFIRSATLASDQQAAMWPGQVINLSHRYTADASGTVVFDVDISPNSPVSVALFSDANCDGTPEEPITASQPINPDTEICLVARVTSGSGAPNGASAPFQVSAVTTYGNTGVTQSASNTDRITIETQQSTLRLTKTVRNVTANTAVSTQNSAASGDVLEYKITVENIGTLSASDIAIFDRTPPYTSLSEAIESPVSLGLDVTCSIATSGANTAGYSGDLEWQCSGSFAPGAKAGLAFRVRVAP